ncbi:peptidoglycan editing factor PgeF [Congregibacter sp.]|uniref:peptidoglycan editing factor PgeF n=1 Tax=Congregibacter sp. TaxID=2744308 RepID=UPI003F6CB822
MSVVKVSPRGWPGNVRIFYTTRTGGHSEAPFHGFNLGLHVGDDLGAVKKNRADLLAQLPAATEIAWLEQVHGTQVVQACDSLQTPARADASWTGDARVACAVMVADCLPVLLSNLSGTVVAAVHAGWRGLAAGVLESAVSALNVAPRELCAWLGPAIGREAFEVGAEVRSTFLRQDDSDGCAACFRASPTRAGHYLADLSALATLRLDGLGLRKVEGIGLCTAGDAGRFFSYRRDDITGRMACLILREY